MKVFDEKGRLTVSSENDFGSFSSMSVFVVNSGLTVYFNDSDTNIRIKNGKLQIKIGALYYSLIGQLINNDPVLSFGDVES
jgi:hypothetical protein